MTASVRARSTWRAVGLPDEHGGGSLTAEPALLGLLVAPSGAGVALAAAGLIVFVAWTPLKLVLVDRRRAVPPPWPSRNMTSRSARRSTPTAAIGAAPGA